MGYGKGKTRLFINPFTPPGIRVHPWLKCVLREMKKPAAKTAGLLFENQNLKTPGPGVGTDSPPHWREANASWIVFTGRNNSSSSDGSATNPNCS